MKTMRIANAIGIINYLHPSFAAMPEFRVELSVIIILYLDFFGHCVDENLLDESIDLTFLFEHQNLLHAFKVFEPHSRAPHTHLYAIPSPIHSP